MKLLLILSLFFFVLTSNIQAQNKDSLLHLTKNQLLDSKNRLIAFEELSRIYLMENDSLIEKLTVEGIELARKNANQITEANLKNNLGAYYSAIGKLDLAIQSLQEAENCMIKIDKESKTLLNIYINFSQVYLSDAQPSKALIQAEKGLVIQQKKFTNDSTLRANLLYIKGWALLEDSVKIQEAPAVLKEAFIYADNQTDNSSYYVILNSIAAVYSTLNIPDSTIKYAKLCLNAEESDIKGGAFLHLASAYQFLNKPLQAIPNYLKAIEQFKITQNVDGLKEAFLYLSKAYDATKNHQAAYQYLEKYAHLSDSLNSSERKESLAKLEIEYETFRKDASIKELDLQSSRKSIIIGFILSMIVLILIVLYFLFQRFRSQKKHELLKVQLEESQKSLAFEKKAAESELKALKSQMNPHFIFNALNGIQEQFMYGDKRKANEQLENFTWLTRQILQVSGKKKIPLNLEIEILTKYLDLEKMRFHEGFTYSLTLSENIDDDYLQIPPMLIQPFVENAVKHGLLHKKGDKKLNISFEFLENQSILQIIIEDNGIGRERAEQNKKTSNHESFSTYSVEQRLQLLSQSDDFKAFTYFDLKDEQGNPIGTKVIINIPV